MVKWIGAVFLTVSGAGLGFEYAGVFRKRYDWYGKLCIFLQLLAQEIRYGHALLAECFEGIRPMTDGFFEALCEGMAEELRRQEGLGVSAIWTGQIRAHAPLASCSRKDLEELEEFGAWLGAARMDVQLDYILKYRERAVNKRDELLALLPAREKMCRSLGLCGGLFLTILFL